MKPPPLQGRSAYTCAQTGKKKKKKYILKVEQDGTLLGQLAVDKVQAGGREAVGVGDEGGAEGQVGGGAVLGDGLAGGVGEQGADLAGVEQGDEGAEAGDGAAAEGAAAEAAVLPLGPGAGDEEGEDGAGDEREGADEARDLAGGEPRAGVARHGCPSLCDGGSSSCSPPSLFLLVLAGWLRWDTEENRPLVVVVIIISAGGGDPRGRERERGRRGGARRPAVASKCSGYLFVHGDGEGGVLAGWMATG